MADEHGCDAFLTPGDVDALDPVLVPIRGDVDLVMFGETEPALVERVRGDALSRMVEGIGRPALVVRDVA